MLNILAILFTQTELTPELQMDIFFVLKTMIKTHFKDDEKKLRELLKMIMETIPKPDYKNMSLYEICIMNLDKTIENRDKTIENRDKTIENRDKTIEDYKIELKNKDKTIDDYKEQNKKLKKLLGLKNNGG